MDDQEQRAWRAWVSEQTLENAQQWAIARCRSIGQPKGTELVSELEDLDDKLHAVLEEAADVYLSKPYDEALIVDYHWLTQCHYWLLEARPSPGMIAKVGKLYAEHDMELVLGEEAQARFDHGAGVSRSKTSRPWRDRAERAEKDRDYADKQARVAQAETMKYRAELARSSDGRLLQAAEDELAGLRVNYENVMRENERLTKVIQDMHRSPKVS